MAARAGIIPYKSENGKRIPSPCDGNGWRTGGFGPALMWRFYAATREDAFLQEARRAKKAPSPEQVREGAFANLWK